MVQYEASLCTAGKLCTKGATSAAGATCPEGYFCPAANVGAGFLIGEQACPVGKFVNADGLDGPDKCQTTAQGHYTDK